MKFIIFIFSVLVLSQNAQADFGEIDIIVQESVEDYFRENNREVDLASMTYEKDPVIADGVMVIETAVNGVQGFTFEWGLHYCTTKLKIVSSNEYEDLGSDCLYDTDR